MSRYKEYQALGLDLNMLRGQPSDADFDLSNDLLVAVEPGDTTTTTGLDIRNYPGGTAGIPEARELMGSILGIKGEETVVGNNSSLLMMSDLLKWALLRGLKHSQSPWVLDKPKMIVTVPGYDRHFTLLEALGFEMVPVSMASQGPDIERIEELAARDPQIKGLVWVPVYSNPTGDTTSDEVVRRLAAMPTAAPDFTLFADNAYVIHHLVDEPDEPLNLLRACEEAGNPDRVILFGSTSKVTFSGSGLSFFGASTTNVSYLTSLMSKEFIGPNKVVQYQHVKFLQNYPGGIPALMKAHAAIQKPKFDAVQEVLAEELKGTGLASWSNPKGGYFVSLDTSNPVADKVVRLAAEAGVKLTPAGATFPFGEDPNNSNIRIAPTRPPLDEVRLAMQVVAECIKLASD